MQHIPPDSSVPPQASADEHPNAGRFGESSHRPAWIVLAHVLRPQGRKGEVLAELYTDHPEQFDSSKRVFLAREEFAGSLDEARSVSVASWWLPVGKNSGRIVFHFAGISSIEDAESLAGLDVLIPSTERYKLDEETHYVSDLVGCALFHRIDDSPAIEIGTVIAVQHPTTSDGTHRLEEAASLLVIEARTGGEVLVPFVKAFLVSIDIASRRIEMSLPAGLLEINSTE